MPHYDVKRDHYTSGAAYKAGETREMDESDAVALVSLGVLEPTTEPRARASRKGEPSE